MDALEALPLFALLLEIPSVRVPDLRDPRRRSRLVPFAVAALATTVVLLTSQALIGQSIVAPSGIVLTGGIRQAVAAVVAAIVVMRMLAASRAPTHTVFAGRRLAFAECTRTWSSPPPALATSWTRDALEELFPLADLVG